MASVSLLGSRSVDVAGKVYSEARSDQARAGEVAERFCRQP